LAAFLFELGPEDPWALLAALGCLGTAALLATAAPVCRALRVEPMASLRSE
jgi:hypothetical protein